GSACGNRDVTRSAPSPQVQPVSSVKSPFDTWIKFRWEPAVSVRNEADNPQQTFLTFVWPVSLKDAADSIYGDLPAAGFKWEPAWPIYSQIDGPEESARAYLMDKLLLLVILIPFNDKSHDSTIVKLILTHMSDSGR